MTEMLTTMMKMQAHTKSMAESINFGDYFERHSCYPCKMLAANWEPIKEFFETYALQMFMMLIQMTIG